MNKMTLENYYYRYPETHEKEYLRRQNSTATIKFDLSIKTKFGEVYELFGVLHPDMMLKSEKFFSECLARSKRGGVIQAGKVKEFYFNQLMYEELKSTNEIEGVSSTKQDYVSASFSMNKNSRFYFITNKYMKLINEGSDHFTDVSDFRLIYDQLMTNEIKEDLLPDGSLFRKKEVFVFKGDGSTNPVHSPFKTEDLIIEHLDHLINFINNDDIPLIVKIAVAHYYFEYIHPFYDGNGRLGRYIASSMLYDIDEMVALKLSSIIKNNMKRYLDSFVITSGGFNKGEATSFIDFFLDMVLEASAEIDNDIAKIQLTFSKLGSYINHNLVGNYDQHTIDSFSILAQARMTDNLIKTQEISDSLSISYGSANSRIKTLMDNGYVIRGEQRGVYLLSDDIYYEILNQSTDSTE